VCIDVYDDENTLQSMRVLTHDEEKAAGKLTHSDDLDCKCSHTKTETQQRLSETQKNPHQINRK